MPARRTNNTENAMNMSETILAFIPGVGGQEMILVFLVVLLLFGAKKLPELARGLGRSLGEFKNAKQEFEHEIARAEQDK